MFGVLPRIEQPPAAPVRKRNIVWPIENEFERIAVSSKAAVTEPTLCCGVLRVDPGQRLRAFGLLEPKVGIIVGRFDRRSCIGNGHSNLLNSPQYIRERQRTMEGTIVAI